MIRTGRILIGCEKSARVRDAFRARGHDAWSCDTQPTTGDPAYHIQADLLTVLDDGWDMLIAFPPCTYLSASGLHWNRRRPGRDLETTKALAFVRQLMACKIPLRAIENPVGCINTDIGPPHQIIQPWQFGDPESKKTCLWLFGLPPLRPTRILELPRCGHWQNQTPSRQNKLNKTQAEKRALTYLGIANAMASQWGRVRLRGKEATGFFSRGDMSIE